MKKMLWMLAAAASLAACHNRGEDDMGAAPEKGDTTAVTNDTTTGKIDTTATTQPADTAMTPTTPTDTTSAAPVTPTDTTAGQYPTTPTDTTSAAPVPTTPDTSSMGQDSGMSADTSGTSSTQPPAAGDSTKSQ